MEKDIDILKNLIKYLQLLIDGGVHKIIYNDLMWDEKTIDCINSIKNLIKAYKELEEYYKEQNEVNAKFIPKSKVKEKIEELFKKLEEPNNDRWEKDDDIYYNQIKAQIRILKELLEEE